VNNYSLTVPNRFKRIAALTLTLILIFPLAIVAANWQMNRHHEREKLNSQITQAINSKPLKIDSAKDLAKSMSLEYRKVSISGDATGQTTWWRKQSLDGIPGFIALTPFQFSNGSKVVLALGWASQPFDLNQIQSNNYLARIRLIRNFEKDPGDLPVNQTNTPASVIAGNDRIYLEIISPKINKLSALPLPEITAGPHLGYVGQWILIAIFAVVVYVIAIRNLPAD